MNRRAWLVQHSAARALAPLQSDDEEVLVDKFDRVWRGLVPGPLVCTAILLALDGGFVVSTSGKFIIDAHSCRRHVNEISSRLLSRMTVHKETPTRIGWRNIHR